MRVALEMGFSAAVRYPPQHTTLCRIHARPMTDQLLVFWVIGHLATLSIAAGEGIASEANLGYPR